MASPGVLSRLLQWLGWPVISGVIIALIFLLSQPQIRSKLSALLQQQSASERIEQLFTQPNSYAEAVKRAAPAVVNIYTRVQARPNKQNSPAQSQYLNPHSNGRESQQSALGSGVIVSDLGYLLTNNHVIQDASEIIVILHDGREAHAQIIGRDADTDLAVLKIELDNLTAIELGSPSGAQVGDIVLAIGNPFGVGQTVTQGIISAMGRYGLGLNTYENFLQTDAAINPGNSGGALIDANGRLLGINTAVLDKIGLASVGIGFAVPADTAMKTLEDIVQHGSVVRGWLGIEARQMTPQLARALGTETMNGVVITGIYNNGPAHMAGLQPKDIIVQIDDRVVGDGRLSMYQIARLEPGEGASLIVLRQGKRIRINAVVGTRPTPKQ
jgi:serine protease DegS